MIAKLDIPSVTAQVCTSSERSVEGTWSKYLLHSCFDLLADNSSFDSSRTAIWWQGTQVNVYNE